MAWGQRTKWSLIIGLMIILLTVGFFFLYRPGIEGPIEVKVDLNQDTYHIGDEMVLDIEVIARDGYQVKMPQILPPEGVDLAQKETKNWRVGLRYNGYRATYTFLTFEPGEYQLPKIKIDYLTPQGQQKVWQGKVYTLRVESLLTDDVQNIKGPKPLAKAPFDKRIIFIVGGVILLILFIYLYIRFLKKRRKNIEEESFELKLPSHQIAYQQLKELQESDLLERGEIEEYFTRLSRIVRQYIENRYDVKAQEMTTQEFLEKALGQLSLNNSQKLSLKEFLYKSDMVKYAKHIPPVEQIEDTYNSAKRFIDETRQEDERGEEYAQ